MTRFTPLPLRAPYWARLWSRRDAELTDAGEAGERLVARARFAVSLLIVLVPLVSVVREPERTEHWVGLGASLTTVVLSSLVLLAVQRGWRPRWLGFVTCLYDVTVVSSVLASFVLLGAPHMAINSRVTFQVYFLAIAATGLRYDRRICLVTGCVAAAQYGLIVWWASTHWNLNDPAFAPFRYGQFSAPDQAGRIILLLVATWLSVTLVDRTERLRILSTHDGLTHLYNRAYFDERLVEELLRARRYARPISVAMLDLDRFKQVNDRHGHTAGDAALRAVATLLRDSVRRTDIVARFGGEEFAIILPETSGEDAHGKIEKVRQLIAESAIALPRSGQTIQLTISAGVAWLPGNGDCAEDLVACADARLLEAKAAGRNRVSGWTATVA